MKRIIIVLSLFALAGCSETISEFQSENFIKFFGNGNGSSVASTIETSDGYVFTGYDSNNGRKQVYVAKTDVNGNGLWNFTLESDSIQQGQFIRPIDNSNYIIVGSSQASNTGNSSPILIKLSNSGELQWKKDITNDGNLKINDIAIIEGTILLAGEFSNNSSTTNYFAANYTIEGEMVWEYTSVSNGAFKKIFVNNNQTCYFIGNNTNSVLPNITINKLTASNPISDIPRKITFDSNFIGIADIQYDSENLYILIENRTTGAQVIKLDKNFNDVWTSNNFPSEDIQITPKSMVIHNNKVLICGENNDIIYFLSVDNQGNSYSSDTYRNFYGNVSQIITTSDGGLLISGSTSETFYEMMQIIKTNSELYLLNN